MSIPLVVNGVTFDYPEVDDVDWGAEATDWAAAVTSGMLQKSAGLFQLLADVDFGTAFGVKSLYFKTRTANNASAGQYRLARADVVSWRNQAADGNLDLAVNSSNLLTFDGTTIQNSLSVTDTTTIDLTLAADVLSADIRALSITDSLISASAAIAFSKLEPLNSTNILVGSAGNVATSVTVTGDVTIGNTGVTAIGANKVTNAMLAQMATATFKGRTTSGTGNAEDLTVTQATALLNAMVGDSGSGGTKGLAPAPAAGDAALNKFLKANGTWTTPPGAGDVVGPGSATDNGFVRFDGTTGKLVKNSPATITNADVIAAAGIVYSKLTLTDSIVNADINSSAAIAYSKLALTGSIVNADINASAAIVYSKLSLTDSILNADINSAAAIAFSKLATLTAAHILVGSAGGVATDTAVTGDISITSGGVTAYAGTVPLNKGGTGQTTKAPAFDALSPMSAGGDIIYGGASGTGTRLVNGSSGQVLTSAGGTSAPTWVTPTSPNLTITSQSATYNALTTDNVILASGAAFTINLYAASGNSGKQLRIKKTDSTLANIITIDGNASETIDGATTTTLNTQYEEVTIVCDGSSWHILDRHIPNGISTSLFAFAPSAGYGTVANAVYYTWREGQFLNVRIGFNNGTAAASTGSIVFPSGLVLDTTGLISGNKNVVGTWVMCDTSAANNYPNRAGLVFIRPANTDRIYMNLDNASATLNENNVTQVTGTSGSFWNFNFKIPVSGWNS